MRPSEADNARLRVALDKVRQRAERACQADDLSAVIEALASVRDTTIQAASIARQIESDMRPIYHKTKEFAS